MIASKVHDHRHTGVTHDSVKHCDVSAAALFVLVAPGATYRPSGLRGQAIGIVIEGPGHGDSDRGGRAGATWCCSCSEARRCEDGRPPIGDKDWTTNGRELTPSRAVPAGGEVWLVEAGVWYQRWKRKKPIRIARALVAKELAKSVYVVLHDQVDFNQELKGTPLTRQKRAP